MKRSTAALVSQLVGWAVAIAGAYGTITQAQAVRTKSDSEMRCVQAFVEYVGRQK